jgi:transposase-like protein
MDDDHKRLRWQDLDGQERYRVIELLRRGEVELKELCRTFGVSRQTLHRAAREADRASIEALERKPRGRPPVPATEHQMKDLQQQRRSLEKQLKQMMQRYEVAQALLDLQRKADQGEPLLPEKKTPRPAHGPDPTGSGPASADPGVGYEDGGPGVGDDPVDSDGVDPAPGPGKRSK